MLKKTFYHILILNQKQQKIQSSQQTETSTKAAHSLQLHALLKPIFIQVILRLLILYFFIYLDNGHVAFFSLFSEVTNKYNMTKVYFVF